MRSILWIGLVSIAPIFLAAQDAPSIIATDAGRLTSQYINDVSNRSARMSADIDKQTAKYLDKLQKQEAKLQHKLSKIDSVAAHNIFVNSEKKYEQLREDVKNKSQKLLKGTGQYIPWLDSSSSALKFLQNNPALSKLPVNPSQLKDALGKVHELENQLKQAENIKEFVRQRKEYLRQQLKNYDVGKDLKKYNEQAYYYTQQINEYKAALDDPDKIERKALELLRNVPAFNDFMSKHGMLAGLFNIPQDYAATGVNGLQTISQVQSLIQSNISNMGANGSQMAQQNIASAQSMLSQLRNKFPNLGNPGDMPDFKPNAQKTKTFLQRLQYGVNMQTVKSNNFFPTTTDIGASLGYKLNEKSVVGVGASYKFGWGRDIRHISFSHQGVGLRSFADIKLIKSFWISGGAEFNYRSQFSSFTELKDYTAWQKSALLGISKTISLKTKFFKSTKVQLLYDFLYKQQIPVTQPLVFRAGYNF